MKITLRIFQYILTNTRYWPQRTQDGLFFIAYYKTRINVISRGDEHMAVIDYRKGKVLGFSEDQEDELMSVTVLKVRQECKCY
mgnify:CR=1 FL=1